MRTIGSKEYNEFWTKIKQRYVVLRAEDRDRGLKAKDTRIRLEGEAHEILASIVAPYSLPANQKIPLRLGPGSPSGPRDVIPIDLWDLKLTPPQEEKN